MEADDAAGGTGGLPKCDFLVVGCEHLSADDESFTVCRTHGIEHVPAVEFPPNDGDPWEEEHQLLQLHKLGFKVLMDDGSDISDWASL